MDAFQSFIGKTVELEISGNIERVGLLIDFGPDILVIFDGANYVYIPFGHIQSIRWIQNGAELQSAQQDSAYSADGLKNDSNELTFRKILIESKGMFVQIFVTGNQSIHGYVTHVMQDYFVFYSPVHKTLYIPMFHLKWLLPYPENRSPYSVKTNGLPSGAAPVNLAQSFEEQLKKTVGNLVVFDMGSNPDKIGLINSVQNHVVELTTADQKPVYWNIHHMKTAHFPDL